LCLSLLQNKSREILHEKVETTLARVHAEFKDPRRPRSPRTKDSVTSKPDVCKGNPRRACRRDNHHNARPGRLPARPMEPRRKLTWLHRHTKGSLFVSPRANDPIEATASSQHKCPRGISHHAGKSKSGKAKPRPSSTKSLLSPPEGRSAPNPHQINRRPFAWSAWSGQALLWDLVSRVGLVGLCVGC